MLIAAHTGFWTANRLLVVLNAVLATGAVVAMVVGILTMRSSNRLTTATEDLVKATSKDVEAAVAALDLSRQQVQVGQQQSEHLARTVQGSIRPLLVDVPRVYGEETGTITVESLAAGLLEEPEWEVVCQVGTQDNVIHVSAPLRNIGPGPAFIRGLGLDAGGISYSGTMTQAVVPPGESTRVSFDVAPTADHHASLLTCVAHAAMVVEVAYSDLEGRMTKSQLHLHRPDPQGPAWVRQVMLYRQVDGHWENEPFASSGPVDH